MAAGAGVWAVKLWVRRWKHRYLAEGWKALPYGRASAGLANPENHRQ